MIRHTCIALFFIVFSTLSYSQLDEIWLDSAFENSDTAVNPVLLTPSQVEEMLLAIPRNDKQLILGGYISSLFHEAIDSVSIILSINGQWKDTIFCHNGFFSFIIDEGSELVDLLVSHPDYHYIDTSLVLSEGKVTRLSLTMEPKYKILLRGRVYAGNMPLEGVDVNVRHLDNNYHMITRGCFYDKEDYWNCLFDGMFKAELTAETPEDSIWISLTMNGMKPYEYRMTFNEYQGEIMQFKLKYESLLPQVPSNNISLKLGFPFLSLNEDWFVSLSYHRLVSGIKRLGYGLDANMFITNVTVPLDEPFDGLDPATVDSSYINTFIGPSLLYYFISPERRMFSSYVGCTFSMNVTEPEFVPQLFLGTRVFLDLNKALNLELRYSEFDRTITHYTFNPYGNAHKRQEKEVFTKFNATIGIQVVF